MSVSGRVGKAPVYGRTPKGQPKLTFQLAEHPGTDETVWHHVVAFGKRAEGLRGTLERGAAVEVIGYEHTWQGRTEIYATAVRPLLESPRPVKK